MPPKVQATKPAVQSKPAPAEEVKEVNDATATQEQTEAQAEAQTEAVLSQVSESETSAPDQPLTDAELEGLALTAKLNDGMKDVFVEPEYRSRIGVFNEANRVEGVPADSVITWATPNWVDHGMHLNWLLTEGGHRLVNPREVSSIRDGRGIFIPGRFEAKGDQVEQNGAVLCIAKRAYAEAHRKAVYEDSRQRSQGATDSFQAQGEALDPHGAQLARSSDKVDMGRYTPMRDA